MDKPKKKKGPIRFEAIVPFIIVSALAIGYFTLFFDLHLRHGIEWAGSRLHGAELNVGSLRTSFWNASIQLGDLELTDKNKPEQNILQVGKIRVAMVWDALLRGKAVIDLASVLDIQTGTARKRPGRLYPSETRSRGLEILRSQISGTILGDIARMLEGFDPTQGLKNLGNLKSATRIQELRSGLEQKQKAWNETLQAIPGEKDFAALQQRINAIQTGGKNPAEIQAQVSSVTGLISEIDQKIRTVETQGNTLSGDVASFGNSIGQIDTLVKQDVQDLESRIQLPKLDSKSLAKDLFGPKVVSQVGQIEKYVAMSREAMPSKFVDKTEAKPVSPPRGKGKLYQFGRPNSYPLFWLKKAEFSSRAENTPLGGNVAGELLDLTSSQAELGRPTKLKLSADFPKRGVLGLQLSAILDHTGETPMESLQLSAASFPVERQDLSSANADGSGVKFAITKAIGSAGVQGTLKGDQVSLNIETRFREAAYEIAAKSKVLESTLQAIVKGIPEVSVQAGITGTWADLGMTLQSNLATVLEQGFQKQLQAQVAEARLRIQSLVNDQVGKGKTELSGRYQEARGKVTGQLDEKRKKAEELKAQANAKLASLKSQVGGKGLEGLRKKLPFGR